MTARIAELLRALGARIVNNWVWRLGFACRFLWVTLKESGASLRRFHLTIREIYFTGVLSLIIILVSGLFVGMVLALQGYDTLVRFGSSEVLGVLVSLSRLLSSIRSPRDCSLPAVREAQLPRRSD